MAVSDFRYLRLPGSGRRLVSVTRLWLGEDHLLQVERHSFGEDYRRFYFREIKLIVTQRTNRGRNMNIVFGVLTALLLLAIWASRSSVWEAWLVPAVCLGVLLISNALKGPTCVTRVHTAAQTAEIYSLNRLRRAHRVIDRLRPLIERAQGHDSTAPRPAGAPVEG
ncbi:MAG: hypothetical protein HYX75_20840 [Acidobacteria bacterium]|nr:hypothetical protein [Acidobacteriota bacterium]